MVTRISGALSRAFLMALLIATPALSLPGTSADTVQVTVFLALIAAVLTFSEYIARAPSLVEFRDAPPFNRIRFLTLFAMVGAIALFLRGQADPTTLTRLLTVMGRVFADVVDVPYSPVRLMLLTLPEDAPTALAATLRVAAGLSSLISILALLSFVLCLRLAGWPVRHGGFNVWVNLPTFDPTRGGDVVERLNRDAGFNLVLGFLLPFLIPAAVRLADNLFNPVSLADPHTLIWTMTAWAFLPASLLMRGLALGRVASLIAAQRARATASRQPGLAAV